MKWKNRGHEFDKLGSCLQTNKQIYIYWTEKEAYNVTKLLSFLGEQIHIIRPYPGIGHGIEKIKTVINFKTAKKSLSLQDILTNPYGKIILIPSSYSYHKILISKLNSSGFIFNNRLFQIEDFLRKYLLIYAFYVKKIVYFPDISFVPSTKCNLNCKCCLNLTPFLKIMKDEPIDRLKKEVDLFFSKVDYIGLFHISGGEPSLYPNLSELLIYINENYRNQIYKLAITTNGTQKFSDTLLTILSNHKIFVIVDDYTYTLKKFTKQLKELLISLNKYKICYIVNRPKTWIDLAPDITNHYNMNEDELTNFFNKCDVPWCEYYNGKLYSCNYAHYAEKAGLTICDNTEYINFFEITDNKKSELIEFRFGYTEKGYMEFCKRCAGFNNNPYKRIPAEQISVRNKQC